MKFNLSWGLLLLLAGCQITQPTTSVPDSETNSPAAPVESVYNQSKLKSAAATVARIKHQQSNSSETPQTQIDLWQRISMQFSLPVPDNKKVDYYRNWFLKHPGHLQTVAQRAEPFLYLITEKVEQRNFPLELALLPVVESSFDTQAYSQGKAVGLWQFLSGTAKRYGLEQDFWYDGRRDVYASTEAALDYLSYLNQRFDGNWYHAIAAYNSGGGRVSSAIRKNQKANKPTDFFNLSLPKETSSYVPKLLALADVIANREAYGLEIPAIANKPYLKVIEPNEQLDLRIAANYADMNYQTLRALNPGYKQWATSPTGAQRLLVPLEKASLFNQKLAQNRGKGIRYERYRVKSGDSIGVLAQRYNIPTSSLKKTNNLKSNLIRIGQYLLIPTRNPQVTTDQQLANLIQSSSSTGQVANQVTHTVQSGDTLWKIARQHKVSHQQIAQWNNIKANSTLKVGQQLVVKQLDKATTLSNLISYQVKPGDTLSEIAQQFNISSQDIVKWNQLDKSAVIRVGQTLRIYLPEGSAENA